MTSWRIPRRTFLTGLGASLLLPALDVMTPRKAAAGNPTVKPRLAMLYLPLSVYGGGLDLTKNDPSRYFSAAPDSPQGAGAWRPTTVGALPATLPPVLQPLEAVKQKLMIVSGLSTPGSGQHSIALSCWATGNWNADAPPDSIDQALANSLGLTPGSTIALAPHLGDFSESSGGHGGVVSTNSQLGGNCVVPKVTDAQKWFDQLFGNCNASFNAAKAADEKSVLDYVQNSTAAIQAKLGKEDALRLDSYLQNIRDLEVRLAAATACPSLPSADPPLGGGDLDWLTKVNLMVDVIALALGSGAMPVASLMTDIEATSSRPYSGLVDYVTNFIGIGGNKIRYSSAGTDTHFDIAHNAGGGNVDAIEQYIAYTQFQMTYLRRLMDKLAAMPAEPNGLTPLDNSIILAGSCHGDGGGHTSHNVPTLVAGGKAFNVHQGEHVALPMDTAIGNFHFTLLQALGVEAMSFNGFNTKLPGLFG